MRKPLLPVEKHLRIEPGRHGGLRLGMRHDLKFTYLIREVTLKYAHQQFEALADSVTLRTQHGDTVTELDLTQRRVQEQQNKHLKVMVGVDNIFAASLELIFEFSAGNLQRLTQSLLEEDPTLADKHKDGISPAQLFPSCFLGLEMHCYNLEIFQDIDSRIDLINIADQLRRAHRYAEAQQITLHIAFIAKHRLKLVQAEQLLLGLLPRLDHKGKQQVLMNLIDTIPESMGKVRYIVELARLRSRSSPLSNEAELMRPASLFKHCRHLIDVVTAGSDMDSFIGFYTYLNVVTFFVNQVACSIADSLLGIFQHIIAFATNRKVWKRIRNESAQNHQLLVQCINAFFESVRCCSLSFSSLYVQQYVEYLIDKVCFEELSFLRRPLSLVLISFLSKEIRGVKLRIRFDQWFSIAYYVEGADLTRHFQVDLKMYSNKECKEEMSLLEEDLKNNALFNLTSDATNQFIAQLSQHFIQLMLNPQVNFLLLHHFLELANIFCISCSEHNRDIKPGFTAALLPLYKPLKMLVCKLVDAAIEPIEVFRRAWEIFVELFTTVDEYLEETLLDVIMSMLNRHLCRGDINTQELPFVDAVCISLPGFSNMSGQFSELVDKVFLRLCQLIPNSIHTESIYALLGKLIVFRPKVLESRQVLEKLLDCLTIAYTDEDDRWRQFTGDIGKRILACSSQYLYLAIEYLCQPPRQRRCPPGKKNKRSQQQQRVEQDSSIRKVHVLNRWLKLSREMGVACRQPQTLIALTDNIVQRILKLKDPKQLNIEFHRFYSLAKHLVINGVELNTRYFSLFEMQHSPTVFGCLVLMAGNRRTVSQHHYPTYFRVALDQINTPWRNIADLAFYLVAHFAQPNHQMMADFLAEMVASDQQYPNLMALSILNSFCLEYQALTQVQREQSPLHEIMASLAEPLSVMYDAHSSKEQEDLTYYVVNKLRRHFPVLGAPQKDYMLTSEEEQKLVQALKLTHRMEAIVEREFAKESEDYLRTEVFLPRKTELTLQNGEDAETMLDNVEEAMPAPVTQFVPQTPPPPAKEQVDPIQAKPRVPIRQIQLNVSTPKTPPIQSPVAADNRPFKKASQPEPARLFSTPRANQLPSANKQKESTNKRTPKHSVGATAKHNSPIVEVESKNEKFRINLGHLNERWREGLEMIHRKTKPPPQQTRKRI